MIDPAALYGRSLGFPPRVGPDGRIGGGKPGRFEARNAAHQRGQLLRVTGELGTSCADQTDAQLIGVDRSDFGIPGPLDDKREAEAPHPVDRQRAGAA